MSTGIVATDSRSCGYWLSPGYHTMNIVRAKIWATRAAAEKAVAKQGPFAKYYTLHEVTVALK